MTERICINCGQSIHDAAWMETIRRNNWNGLSETEYEHMHCPTPCPRCESLRAQIEALANEMETDDRAGKLAHWIISLRKIAEKEAGENGMDILDRAIDRIEEHSWTQDGPMSDEDDAAIDLLKECREAAERELYAEKEAK